MIDYEKFLRLNRLKSNYFLEPRSSEFYQILLMTGKGTITVDGIEYPFEGKVVLFTSPYQSLSIKEGQDFVVEQLAFHGDFYCIEYHKKEVACNGLLFNNIYKQPFIQLKDHELPVFFEKIREELKKREPFSEPVLKSYLQLILAISSKIKKMDYRFPLESPYGFADEFKGLLEKHFLTQRTPQYYANQLALSPGTLGKKCKQYFGKSPSRLIQERVILESKRQLHLTHQNIKEIAGAMNFHDEHYFSRFFKKHTGISPSYFREKVGISIVANLSMK